MRRNRQFWPSTIMLVVMILMSFAGSIQVRAQEGSGEEFVQLDHAYLVDQVSQHTDDRLFQGGEDYEIWRQYLTRSHPTVPTIHRYFVDAAEEFDVPVELLEAIGQVESNWAQIGPSIDRGWGIMHLVQNNYCNSLEEAAELIGVSPQTLKDDARANIRGAAALIAEYAGPNRESFDDLTDWFSAAKQFSCLVDDELRTMQAQRYYETIRTGSETVTLWGEPVTLVAHPDVEVEDAVLRSSSAIQSTDYPPALTNLTSCNYASGRAHDIDTWVNHWIGYGTYAGAISWFHNCSAIASAHFVVSNDGEITQVVRVADTAWHTGAVGYPDNNPRSIGVEHEATLANPEMWNSLPMLQASATMARYFSDQHSIPRTRSLPGIRGHNEMPGTSTACPGPLPWDTWMTLFNCDPSIGQGAMTDNGIDVRMEMCRAVDRNGGLGSQGVGEINYDTDANGQVHNWAQTSVSDPHDYQIQDFTGGSDDPDGATLIYNPFIDELPFAGPDFDHTTSTPRAYFVQGPILWPYLDTGDWDVSNGVRSWLRGPINDRTVAPPYLVSLDEGPSGQYPWSYGGETIGYFERGFISRRQGESEYRAYTYHPAICDVSAEVTTNADGQPQIQVSAYIDRAPGWPEADQSSDPLDAYFTVVFPDGQKRWVALEQDTTTSFSVSVDSNNWPGGWDGLSWDWDDTIHFYMDAYNRRGEDQDWAPRVRTFPRDVILRDGWLNQEEWPDQTDDLFSLTLTEGAQIEPADDNWHCPGWSSGGGGGCSTSSISINDIVFLDNAGQRLSWDHIHDRDLNVVAYGVGGNSCAADSFQGSIQTPENGPISLTFEETGDNTGVFTAQSVPVGDIITEPSEETEIALVGVDSDDRLIDFFENDILSIGGYVDRGIAVSGGNQGRHAPSADLPALQAAGFERATVTAANYSEVAFVKNQADILIYVGHGSHADHRIAIHGRDWSADEGVDSYEIGGEWREDVSTVMLFACSVLDVNDYNANFNDNYWDWKEMGPVDRIFSGENWSIIRGEDGDRITWLGFNAAAPKVFGQNGDNVIKGWAQRWIDAPYDSVEHWHESTYDYLDNASNACAIDEGGYYYWKKWEFRPDALEFSPMAGMKIWNVRNPIPRSEWQHTGGSSRTANLPVERSIQAMEFDHYFNTMDVLVDGPAEVHLYDLEGNHTGPDGTEVDLEILGSHYDVMEDGSVYVQVDSADLALGYTLQLDGLEAGNTDLQIRMPDLGKGHLRSISFFDIPVSNTSFYELTLNREEAVSLLVDSDGDGIFESQRSPDTFFHPRIAHSPSLHFCTERGNQEWFVDDVGIDLAITDPYATGIEVDMGTGWRSYTDTLLITDDGRTDFAYRLLSGDGSPLYAQRASLQIDQTPPTSTLSLLPASPPSSTYNVDVTATITGADGGPSGLWGFRYRLNGGAWLDYDANNPPVITQNGDNIFEYRAFDVAGNVEPTHVVTITLDKTTHTIIPLNDAQANLRAATSAVVQAMLDDQQPLLATQPFTVSPVSGTMALTPTAYPAGTVIVRGELDGSFTRQFYVGPLDLPTAHVLYPQAIALFESASPDERASWELPDLRDALERYPWLHEWPLLDESGIASDTVPSDVVFFPAGATPDVLLRFQETGAADALRTQAKAGRWFVFQGDAAYLAELGGLVPGGTVASDALEPATTALVSVASDSILAYNWPTDLTLTRYSDAPRFYPSDDVIRIADYTDNGEAAIVMRRVGNGGVILIGGHASLDKSSYVLLFHTLFTAAAEPVSSQVTVQQQFMPDAPADVVPGFEPDMPILLETAVTNHGHVPYASFVYTEAIDPGFHLLAPAAVTTGTVTTTETPSGTLVLWQADTLAPGDHELTLLVGNVSTDTLKPGELTISQAEFSYADHDGHQFGLNRPDAVVRAMAAALLAHNQTDEPDNTYPLPPEGIYVHFRHDLENKLETRANNTVLTFTFPYFDLIRDAFDQTIFPTVEGTGENGWVLNEIMGYPGRDYPLPTGAADDYWYYAYEDWDCETWVRIPNPRGLPVTIPQALQSFAYQEPGNGDIWVAGQTLVFDLGTMLPYDWREPAIRYLVHSQELHGLGISFSAEPVTDTLVLEGGGGSVYTAVGQDPIPFREYFPDAAVNNPSAPVTSEIAYTDIWGRDHAVTETVRSSFYDIIPYDRTGDAVDVHFASTYGITGEDNAPMFDYATYQTVTLTIMLKAQSTGRNLSAEQLIIQEMLPRGLGYDIEFVTWEASNGSFQLLDEQTMRVPAFDLLTFQGDLPEDEPQTILITARLRTYPLHPREGSFLVDGGARIATENEWGDPNQFDTAMTHVRVEQGYQSSLETEKWVSSPDVSRHGGPVYEVIRADATADVAHFTEEVYVDATGTVDKAAVIRIGGSRGPNLYFGTVDPGGETMLVLELTNNSGADWTNVNLTYDAPAGITLTPILTDGLEPPPNVYDTPYLWAEEIPDIGRGVYYFWVDVDESVAPGVMYPIAFALNGDNVPSAAEFPLPVGRVGVGGDVVRTLGQAHDIQTTDTSPAYAEPTEARLMSAGAFAAFQALTETGEIDAFFDGLTTTVPVTSRVPPSSTVRFITYTVPAEGRTLPREDGAEITGEWYLLVRTQIGPVEPGTRVVNHGPELDYVDSFGIPWTAEGNPTHVVAHGPALTGTYSILSVTSPFYGGMVIDPLPGEEVDACVDIAVRNEGNYIAASPVVSATVITDGVEILSATPEPVTVTQDGVITWQTEDLLPYGASSDPDRDVVHFEVCLRFTPPDPATRLMMLQDPPFYVPLLVESVARYVDEWGDQPFTILSPVGADYGLHVGADPLPAPDLYSALWSDQHTVSLDWRAVPGAVDYVVYRSTQPDGSFRRVGPVSNGTNLVDIVWDDPLAPFYYYVVRARDANQVEGRHSQVLAVRTGAMPNKVYLPVVLR
jgi:hypothetical protein